MLGPLLFVILISDINQYVGLGTANLFADDMLIYCNANNINEANDKLQGCINEVAKCTKATSSLGIKENT